MLGLTFIVWLRININFSKIIYTLIMFIKLPCILIKYKPYPINDLK